jgi:hypothetical protein
VASGIIFGGEFKIASKTSPVLAQTDIVMVLDLTICHIVI